MGGPETEEITRRVGGGGRKIIFSSCPSLPISIQHGDSIEEIIIKSLSAIRRLHCKLKVTIIIRGRPRTTTIMYVD